MKNITENPETSRSMFKLCACLKVAKCLRMLEKNMIIVFENYLIHFKDRLKHSRPMLNVKYSNVIATVKCIQLKD